MSWVINDFLLGLWVKKSHHSKNLSRTLHKFAIMYQSIPAVPSPPAPPPGYCRAFARLVSPGGGAFANFVPLGGWAVANPKVLTHAVSYQNITTQRILLEKQADWLICQ